MVRSGSTSTSRSSWSSFCSDKFLKKHIKCHFKIYSINQECQRKLKGNYTKVERLGDVKKYNSLYYFCPSRVIKNETAKCITTTLEVKHMFKKLTKTESRTKFYNNPLLHCRPDWGEAAKKILCSGDVELNPGPDVQGQQGTDASSRRGQTAATIKILTYNARGLKDKYKLKRVLNKCNQVLRNNIDTFVLIQETHLNEIECKQIEFLWRDGYCVSPAIGRQGGTLTLFSNTWEMISPKMTIMVGFVH